MGEFPLDWGTGEGPRLGVRPCWELWPQASDKSGEGGGRELDPRPQAGRQTTGMWLQAWGPGLMGLRPWAEADSGILAGAWSLAGWAGRRWEPGGAGRGLGAAGAGSASAPPAGGRRPCSLCVPRSPPPPQQVQEKWHLVDDLSRLLPEPGLGDSLGPESPLSRGSRLRFFCPGSPCPGSPGPGSPRPGPSL